jgi:DNA repair protein RadC
MTQILTALLTSMTANRMTRLSILGPWKAATIKMMIAITQPMNQEHMVASCIISTTMTTGMVLTILYVSALRVYSTPPLAMGIVMI